MELAIIDLLAIQQKSLDRALSLYIYVSEIRSSGVRASITSYPGYQSLKTEALVPRVGLREPITWTFFVSYNCHFDTIFHRTIFMIYRVFQKKTQPNFI